MLAVHIKLHQKKKPRHHKTLPVSTAPNTSHVHMPGNNLAETCVGALGAK